jgi:aryl carrier-like protein
MLVQRSRQVDHDHRQDPHDSQDQKAREAEGTAGDEDRQALEADLETVTERALASIWRQVLGVERVGRLDSFMALGGDSLLALRVLARIRAEFGCAVSLRTLFDQPTLANLARCVDELTLAVQASLRTPTSGALPGEETGVI